MSKKQQKCISKKLLLGTRYKGLIFVKASDWHWLPFRRGFLVPTRLGMRSVLNIPPRAYIPYFMSFRIR